MSIVGTPMALDHSILINLFIKVGLNSFSPTSHSKYCFCLKLLGMCLTGFMGVLAGKAGSYL